MWLGTDGPPRLQKHHSPTHQLAPPPAQGWGRTAAREGLLRPPHPGAPAHCPPRGACGHGAAGQSQPQGAALRPAAEVARRGRRSSAGPPYPQPARGRPLVAVPGLAFLLGPRPPLPLAASPRPWGGGRCGGTGRLLGGVGSGRARRGAGSPRAGREKGRRELRGMRGWARASTGPSGAWFVGAGPDLQVLAKIWNW